MNDAELDGMLKSMSPVKDVDVAAADLDGIASEMRGAIMSSGYIEKIPSGSQRSQLRRRRSVRMAVLTTTAAVLIGGSAAAVGVIQARTGVFGSGGDSEEGAGEFIRLDSPGASAVVDDLARDIPLPPGGDFARMKSSFLQPTEDGRGAQMTESGIESALSADAACQWTTYWLDGFERGDEAQKREALIVLEAIPSWPAVVASDGGGVVDQLRVRAEGARADDPSRFMQDYRINCTGELSPVSE